MAEWLAAMQAAGIGHVLCLNAAAEIARKSPDYAALLDSGAAPWAVHAHPVEDFSAPRDLSAYAAWIAAQTARLRAGETLLLHCAAGIGRTGMTALALLGALGMAPDAAAARVRDAGSFPETEAQRDAVAALVGARPPA
jgi:atypical dual specificity phosphatase